jgi:hypothetical protein
MAENLNNNKYNGKLVLKEICLYAGSLAVNPIIFHNLFAAIRIFIPFLVRYYEHKNAFHDFNWDSWLYSALEVIFTFFLATLNFLFVMVGLIDFQRRKLMI